MRKKLTNPTGRQLNSITRIVILVPPIKSVNCSSKSHTVLARRFLEISRLHLRRLKQQNREKNVKKNKHRKKEQKKPTITSNHLPATPRTRSLLGLVSLSERFTCFCYYRYLLSPSAPSVLSSQSSLFLLFRDGCYNCHYHSVIFVSLFFFSFVPFEPLPRRLFFFFLVRVANSLLGSFRWLVELLSTCSRASCNSSKAI